MRIKAIGKLQVRRADVRAHLNVEWGELDPLRYGYILDIDNESALWLIKNGHCVHVDGFGRPLSKNKKEG